MLLIQYIFLISVFYTTIKILFHYGMNRGKAMEMLGMLGVLKIRKKLRELQRMTIEKSKARVRFQLTNLT